MDSRLFLLLVAFVFALTLGCAGPPQLGDDDESFKVVDALYTAITSKRMPLVEQCAINSKSLKDSGKLSESAFESLDAIISQAREDKWQPAAKDLIWFMKGQRRPKK